MAKLRLNTPLFHLLSSCVLFYCHQQQVKAIGIPKHVFKESLGKFYVFLHHPKSKSMPSQGNGNKDFDVAR